MLFFLFIVLQYGFMPFPEIQVITGAAQGTSYTVKYAGGKEQITQVQLDSIFRVIDLSLSLYEPASLINRFNREGRVKMDEHMQHVINESLLCYKESAGSFDITTGALTELWGFGKVRHQKIPSSADVKKQLAITGSKFLLVKGDSLVALRKGIRIDCNGIAQGYTVDLVASFLSSRGVEQFMVELGGEIRVKGDHPEKGSWRIGVESPDVLAGDWHPVQQVIGLRNASVTTSGNYRKYFNAGGKMYSHVIDPLKGKPVDNGIIAVTVVAADAVKADAWDNALYVMGVEKAMQYLGTRTDLEAYIIYRDKEGHVKDTSTVGFRKFLQ